MLTITIATPSGETILAYVAATPRERRIGASHWVGLPSGRGLLMAFERPGFHEITMVPMAFPLDLVWLGYPTGVPGCGPQSAGYSTGSALVVSCVAGQVGERYRPLRAASYVLELGAGEIQRLGLKLGDVLRF